MASTKQLVAADTKAVKAELPTQAAEAESSDKAGKADSAWPRAGPFTDAEQLKWNTFIKAMPEGSSPLGQV